MQTLNVGAGRTDEQYKAAEEQRRAVLLAESRTNANYFFYAAGMAVVGTGVLGLRIGLFFSIGTIDFLTVYGGEFIRHNPVLLFAAAAAWVAILVMLGIAAHVGHRWAFVAGVALYVADMIALAIMFNLWVVFSIGVHGFLVKKWFEGQKMLQELKQPASDSLSTGAGSA